MRPVAPVARFARLNTIFFALVVVMAAHESEHVAQVVQKNGVENMCPGNCRGLLGFIFDVEWIHFAYNLSIFVAIAALFVAYRLWRPEWRTNAPVVWTTFAVGALGVQGYHVVEHVVKLDQWFVHHHSPTPGVLGGLLPPPEPGNFSLIELHFAFNTVVFLSVIAAYFRFGFHRHTGLLRPRLSAVPALVVVFLLAMPVGVVWALQPPTRTLAAGVHEGPLVLSSPQKLVGERGAVVRGGVVVSADDVTVRNVTVVGGEHGIVVDGAERVVLDGVVVRGALLDGIHVRRASVSVRDCAIESRGNEYAQGIDISFSFDIEPSAVDGCTVHGGLEGIVSHFSKVDIRDNVVTGTRLRGITMTEMSMGVVENNHVEDALGVGLFCGDYSMCELRNNVVVNTRPDWASDNRTRLGYAIVAHLGATATIHGNELVRNERNVGTFVRARIKHG